MSELKVVSQSDVMWNPWYRKYYYKDDVDKLISEKGAFIKTLGEGQADLAREIERLKQELEDVLAEKDAAIAELKVKNESLKEQRDSFFTQATQYKFNEVGKELENRNLRRALWLSRARAAETGRRFWAKEQLFAMREGRKKDSEKAWKMEKRRERQVELFKAMAEKFKEDGKC